MGKRGNITVSTISRPEQKFCGWPTVAKRKNGEILVVCSGGRQEHVCPFGQVHLLRSKDGGNTWQGPEVLADGPLDDRDAGVIETGNGTIIVNWFTSVSWVRRCREGYEGAPLDMKRKYDLWREMADRLSKDVIMRELGHWSIRSEDGCKTWSEKIPTIANSPHGPVELSDGRLLFVGRRKFEDPNENDFLRSPHGRVVGASESIDDGRSWRWVSTIEPAEGDDPFLYHELHAVEYADGKILSQIRNHNERNNKEILQTGSVDGGRTWSRPFPAGIWGYPSHLLRLGDGRILMTYGHRREPYGVQARVSRDGGASWGEAVILLGEGAPRDLGYPSTVQLDEKKLATVWYECPAPGEYAELRMAVWDVPR